MAPRPDLPADGSDDHPEERADGRTPPDAGPVSDEQWAAIVADLRGDLDPTGTARADDPGTADDPAGQDPRTTPGPAVTYPVAPWVSQRHVVRPARRPGAEGQDDLPSELAGTLSGRDWAGSDQFDEAERRIDAEEHFVAADPGPVLGGDPLLTTAWLAVGGLPLFWLVVVVAWRDAPHTLLLASGAVFLLGLAVLVWRMPHHREPSDEDDDGAVV
ncbi:MAG TPA: hypothetical protein VGC67_00850 [Cellulomonas sp.]